MDTCPYLDESSFQFLNDPILIFRASLIHNQLRQVPHFVNIFKNPHIKMFITCMIIKRIINFERLMVLTGFVILKVGVQYYFWIGIYTSRILYSFYIMTGSHYLLFGKVIYKQLHIIGGPISQQLGKKCKKVQFRE